MGERSDELAREPASAGASRRARSRERARARVPGRDFLFVLSLAAIGALGAWPGSQGVPDPQALLCWLAMWAAPAGLLCGASPVAIWPLALVAPASWTVLLSACDLASERVLPSPAWAALAWSGLFALGFGLGRLAPHARGTLAGALFVTALLANALPLASGGWPPALRARLLDIAPATLLAECAGVDWLRLPALYERAGTADLDPALRVPWNAGLAGPAVFLLGCAIAVAGDRIARRDRRGGSSDSR